ncbi:MAG TPA: DISARM system helicase DrmA, partial [Candidatus Stackebrandtia faecavium]|nr:DISARM system helicase DrmA [Candidatus Stackebrandtia faecavium]
DEGRDAVKEAKKVSDQLAEGLEFLLSDAEALRCFRFMNTVMAQQRVHTQVAMLRTSRPQLSIDEARAEVLDSDYPHSWRVFQLAFVLMQLPSLTDPAAQNRSGNLAKAQLLFFPTGGGKTEAYLGLAAFTFAIRRRQGTIDTADGQLNGSDGVSVLMRYTLRLLTSQQFQRATALVCAAEVARAAQPDVWGEQPFRIGLWVGSNVTPKTFTDARQQITKVRADGYGQLSVLQFERCPWCGTKISAANVFAEKTTERVHVYCGDDFGDCPFSEGGEIEDGLPVLTVDDEIYRLTPAFLIATVDKFARLAREGEAASLFGYVSRRCPRHGYVHPDTKSCDLTTGKHPKDGAFPSTRAHPVSRLRPPDLIIQDELHLISGALGTTVGLFEVAVDVMASWRTAAGKPVRPMVVASTATARNAADQVRALYGRDATIFPPQVIDAGDTFFAKEVPVSAAKPGRRYLGISTTGVRLTTAEIRIAEVLLAAGQELLDQSGIAADPYMSLVGYFSATRELAGMARYLSDDVQTALRKGRPWSKLPRRFGVFGSLNVAELTSRVSSTDIGRTLDQMATPFDPEFDSTLGRSERIERRKQGETVARREMSPFDVVLATSMLQVGVDVTRLGLMLVVGQPKNTAEYIQASSRVGRDGNRPGLVISLGNWARPRDLAHFEQFRHYHETFYSQVEALSVTPFSATSVDRGVDGILVSAARVLSAGRENSGLSPEKKAGLIDAESDFVDRLVETLVARIGLAAEENETERASDRLHNRVDQWLKRREVLREQRLQLVYERGDSGKYGPLLLGAENADSNSASRDEPPFSVANSMREVQPEINLLVSPVKEKMLFREPPEGHEWEFNNEVTQ